MEWLGRLCENGRSRQLFCRAKILGISASAVGKSVSSLERQLGARLFQRSTRSLRLTEEGKDFYERCRRILDDLEDAQASLVRAVAAPRGRLRISIPLVSYHLLLPLIPDFVALYPEIELDLDFTDRIVDLIDEGIDVAIRSGDLADSRLMSRSIRPFQMALCAAPAYLERFGTPQHPRELGSHLAIRFRFPNSGKVQDWPFSSLDHRDEPKPRTIITCNNMEALRGATMSGLGIGCMPDFLARSPIANGQMVPILADYLDGPARFHLVWPSNRHLSPKVRVFVDFASERLLTADLTFLTRETR